MIESILLASTLQHEAERLAVNLPELPNFRGRPAPSHAPTLLSLSAPDESEGALARQTLLLLLRQTYGDDSDFLSHRLANLSQLAARFVALYGDGPVEILRAPGRINILGEHIDYVSYLPTASLPFGSREHDMLMLARRSDNGRIRGASTLTHFSAFAFDLSDGPEVKASSAAALTDWPAYLYSRTPAAPDWSNYVKGAVYFSRFKFGGAVRHGFDFLIDASIPPNGGASSSSALVVLTGAACRVFNGIDFSNEDLAHDSAQAEWFVGTRGGAMDHLTICLARPRCAMLISHAEKRWRAVLLPGHQFRWVTFFSHPADKGSAVMLAYNERAAVSRQIIPAFIADWAQTRPALYADFIAARESLRTAEPALDSLVEILSELPGTMTFSELKSRHADVYRECQRSFPALVDEKSEVHLRVRPLALHHVGEIRRLKMAEKLLALQDSAGTDQILHTMQALGALISQSHESLRDLYEVSTPEVEELRDVVLTDPHVLGARLMGGGFGGNILALTTAEHLGALTERVEKEYYAPRDQQPRKENSIMISTPGEGLSRLRPSAIWRAAVEEFNKSDDHAPEYRARLGRLLDQIPPYDLIDQEVWPVIVAAGSGTRARASGLDRPKPLARVGGVTSIQRVLHAVRAAGFRQRRPVVIVSPETEDEIREALSGEEVEYVIQRQALGTGDAVYSANEAMRDYDGLALVVWSTQPVIRPVTISRSLKLSQLFPECSVIFPTAFKENPYAPLSRDERGYVMAARETHLEGAEPTKFGETNIGLFILPAPKMFEALADLHRLYWDEAERRYRRPRGELGFPNELINFFAAGGNEVLACPLADEREEQGIKNLSDIARCEQFITELNSTSP